MVPDKCKDKKITFVLGAGASIPFIRNGNTCLSTSYLTEQITNRERWGPIYDKFKQSIPNKRFPELNFNISLDDILRTIEKIKSINELEVDGITLEKSGGLLPEKINDVYGIGKINFEHILDLIDKYAVRRYDRKNGFNNVVLDLLLHTIDKKELIPPQQIGWHYVPFLCREVLINAILDLWESCQKERAIEVYRQFFASVLEKFGGVNIYSLNYDPLLYEAAKQVVLPVTKSCWKNIQLNRFFETGFSVDTSFNYKEFYRREDVISFLHGHAGFVPSNKHGSMYFEGDYRNAQKKRLEGVAQDRIIHCRSSMKGIQYNIALTTGLDKFEGFYDNPYACYLSRLSGDLIESDYIILIGVGLGDYHIDLFVANGILLSSGLARETGNVPLYRDVKLPYRKKIIFVTLDQPRSSFEDYVFETNYWPALLQLLFKEGIVWDDNAQDLLSKNGYASFGDLFLYRLGAERFLANPDNIALFVD